MPAIIGRDSHTWPVQIGGHRASASQLIPQHTHTHTRNQQMRLEVAPDARIRRPVVDVFLGRREDPCPYGADRLPGEDSRMCSCS
ncbi:hypothetical protein M440DRAFT_1227553 [Trichoderma longibrachiatum ATCC 18648]|uniref:Uncharacterized protein n=1 Tax=Trichoderma longibrachiatum ATCC 18648 TaxID=983965 RepID=A0A2T4C8L0_TRILO|nr:hypothetical protein M440DRAFT_1227553 [Trichoderma longibrachiatum ATCC 18648]